MGFKPLGEERNRFRYTSGHSAPGSTIDVVCAPGQRAGNVVVGTVHHVAFRCASEADQKAWRERIVAAGLNITPVLDRQYFHSIYFREPGGVLFVLEFAGRNARRYGGVVGLSAGLIGPPGRRWDFAGTLDQTPVLLGCSDYDPHIPRDRLEESRRELERIGGAVELEIYAGLGHTINRDEFELVQGILDRMMR